MASKKISYVSGRRGGNLGDGNSKIPGLSYQVKQSQLLDSKLQQQQSQLSDSNLQQQTISELTEHQQQPYSSKCAAYQPRSEEKSLFKQLNGFYLGLTTKLQQKLNGYAISMGFQNFSSMARKNSILAAGLASQVNFKAKERVCLTAFPASSSNCGVSGISGTTHRLNQDFLTGSD